MILAVEEESDGIAALDEATRTLIERLTPMGRAHPAAQNLINEIVL